MCNNDEVQHLPADNWWGGGVVYPLVKVLYSAPRECDTIYNVQVLLNNIPLY